jgi:small-conductance mechanosensitive channel
MLAFGRRFGAAVVIGVAFATTARAQAAQQQAAQQQAAPKAPAARVSPVTADQVLEHLHMSIGWYRRLSTLAQSSDLADNEIAHDRLQRTSLAAVQYSFDFAMAAARLIDASHAASDTSSAGNTYDEAGKLDRAATRMAGRVSALQSRLAALDDQIAHAPARAQRDLAAQRDELQSELNLSLEVQKTILELQRFAANMAAHGVAGTGSLTGQIAELERSVPEARHGTSTATRPATTTTSTDTSGTHTTTTTTAAVPAVVPQPAPQTGPARGLLALFSDWLALRSTSKNLTSAIDATDALTSQIDSLRAAVGGQARTLVRAHAADTGAVDPSQLLQVQHQFDSATTRFRQLSTLLVPIGEEDITVDDARGSLSEWSDIAKGRANDVLGNLVLHAVILLASIAIVLFISEIWRRATFRYLHDARRRRQFLLLRRIAVAVALLTIIVIGFVSEIGSLATYVGFLTAGLAVALQNVILAVVAYFFLIGRYGVRVGDRITLAGVTGRVIDIGLIRIYLMELAGPELQSTGRIVVMSNAVLFQPAALFKQIPGAEYTWHTVTLSLAPTTDVASTQMKLKAVADKVYGAYRGSIDEQHATVQRLVDFDTSTPEPQVDVRFSEQALEFVVRYPVLPEQAATNDQVMMKALREAVGEDAVREDAVRAPAASA